MALKSLMASDFTGEAIPFRLSGTFQKHRHSLIFSGPERSKAIQRKAKIREMERSQSSRWLTLGAFPEREVGRCRSEDRTDGGAHLGVQARPVASVAIG